MDAVLACANISSSDILTLSELPDLRPEEARFLLVDHNKLTGALSKYQGQVTGCIDHHVDENAVPKDAKPRVIETCGSCMSLIVNECRDIWKEVAAESETIAKLALAPILIDTINMEDKQKVRDQDRHAVKFLEEKVGSDYARGDFHSRIAEVKEDIAGLSLRDIFRKDYKEWIEGDVRLGISCVVQDLGYLIEKGEGSADKMIEEFAKWSEEKELDVTSIMTTSSPDGVFQRELLVWGKTQKGVEAVQQFMGINEGLKLKQYKGGQLDDGNTRIAWKQENLAASRKQVAPLLREAVQKVS